MQTLRPLNSTDYFCEQCQIGPADNCTMPHFEQELKRAGSPVRHYLFLIVAILFFAILWLAGMRSS